MATGRLGAKVAAPVAAAFLARGARQLEKTFRRRPPRPPTGKTPGPAPSLSLLECVAERRRDGGEGGERMLTLSPIAAAAFLARHGRDYELVEVRIVPDLATMEE
jgi:hypothetical protein